MKELLSYTDIKAFWHVLLLKWRACRLANYQIGWNWCTYVSFSPCFIRAKCLPGFKPCNQSTIICSSVNKLTTIRQTLDWPELVKLVMDCWELEQLLWELGALSSHSLPFPMDYIPDVSHKGEERKRKRGNTVGLHILKSSKSNTHAHAPSSVTGDGPDLRALYRRGGDRVRW